tara:strand:- start:2107 stop:2385 length:279 start_codon:yes stop_codon:yes gene_type:complete
MVQIKMLSLNSPDDFKIGDTVIVLCSIDSHIGLDELRPGMDAIITSISHRYKGTPNEHHEYWVRHGPSQARYEINQIIKYDLADDIIININK